MHPVALFPGCPVHAVRRYHVRRCHESGRFWVHYAELVFRNMGVPLELGDVCREFIGEDHNNV